MTDEFTPLLTQDAEDQQKLQRNDCRLANFTLLITVLTVTYCIFALYGDIYFGSSNRLVDEGRLPPAHFSKCNFSVPVASEFKPPLRSEGRYILDELDSTVNLKSVNWYGASDIYYIPSGLDVRHRDEISAVIRCMGFNNVRLPYSDEMVRSNPPIPEDHVLANPDLVGLRALDVFTAVIQSLTDAGISVVINNHITQATWCCGINICDTGWANDWLGGFCRVRQTESDWIENWKSIMGLYVNQSLVIGADLRNEVRGLWGTMYWEHWAATAEKAAEALLQMNQKWLIIVEGMSSANDLSGVKERPVRLSIPGRVVYSAHVYSWSGWGEMAPYSTTPYDEFAAAMRKNWAYLLEEDIAPVWVGELGSPDRPTEGDLNYWTHLIRLLAELEADWSYWAINPRKPAGNERESYGLLEDDWDTVRWDYRMRDLLKLGIHGDQLSDQTEYV
jgi:endoglucanase